MQRKTTPSTYDPAGYEDLQDDFLDALAGALRKLKNSDESIESTNHYNFFFNLKNRVFDNVITLETALALMQEFKINSSEFYSSDFTSLKSNLIHMLQARPQNLKYKEDSNQEAVDHLRRTYIDKQHKNTIADKILHQSKSILNSDILKDDFLKLLLALEKQKNNLICDFIIVIDPNVKVKTEGVIGARLSQNTMSDIYLAYSKRVFTLINEALENMQTQGISRMQFILREGTHHYALDIDTDAKSCILMDAAEDGRKQRMHRLPKYVQGIDTLYDAQDMHGVITQEGGCRHYKMQLAPTGCLMFAFDHARNAAKIKDLHTLIKVRTPNQQPDTNNVIKCDWTDFPPRMLKNSQSTTYLDSVYQKLLKRSNSEASELMQLINNNQKCYGIESVKKEIEDKAKYICQNKSANEIEDLINTKNSPQTNKKDIK